MDNDLMRLRAQIDLVDQQILDLLSRRPARKQVQNLLINKVNLRPQAHQIIIHYLSPLPLDYPELSPLNGVTAPAGCLTINCLTSCRNA